MHPRVWEPSGFLPTTDADRVALNAIAILESAARRDSETVTYLLGWPAGFAWVCSLPSSSGRSLNRIGCEGKSASRAPSVFPPFNEAAKAGELGQLRPGVLVGTDVRFGSVWVG